MEVSVNRERLLPILNRVVGVVERRQTIPILGNLLLRAEGGVLRVCGSDLEVEIESSVAAEVVMGGDVTVPAKKLADICRSLAENAELRIKVAGDRCVITADRGRYILGTLPAHDFPKMDTEGMEEVVELEEGTLKRVLEKTAFAMAQQDVRYYLNGLLFQVEEGRIRAVATDGHRLAAYEHMCDVSVAGARSVIIPYKTVNELRRQLGTGSAAIRLEIGERLIRVFVGDTVTSSKLVDGKYPEFERVIPAGLKKVAIAERELLRRALGRTAILSNEKHRGVRLTFEENCLRLIAHNPEQEEAVEDMEVEYRGESTTVGFNVGYLADLLGAVDSERVEVNFDDGNASSLWRGVGAKGEIFVVMPMRL